MMKFIVCWHEAPSLKSFIVYMCHVVCLFKVKWIVVERLSILFYSKVWPISHGVLTTRFTCERPYAMSGATAWWGGAAVCVRFTPRFTGLGKRALLHLTFDNQFSRPLSQVRCKRMLAFPYSYASCGSSCSIAPITSIVFTDTVQTRWSKSITVSL